LQPLEGYINWVTSVVFLADGQRLGIGSEDKTLKIWDAATARACRRSALAEHSIEFHSI
jgi:WD40 repeat protein